MWYKSSQRAASPHVPPVMVISSRTNHSHLLIVSHLNNVISDRYSHTVAGAQGCSSPDLEVHLGIVPSSSCRMRAGGPFPARSCHLTAFGRWECGFDLGQEMKGVERVANNLSSTLFLPPTQRAAR